MQFSQEFFIQRSFEVVWAVFRVAGYVNRKKMREVLENRAVEYLLHKDISNINSLEEVIRLAMHINEITDVNGSVILREINSLKGVLNEINGKEKKELLNEKIPENAPNVEEIFSKPPMLLSDFMDVLDNLPDSGKEVQKSLAKDSVLEKSGKEYGDSFNTSVNTEKVWQSPAKSLAKENLAESGKEKTANLGDNLIIGHNSGNKANIVQSPTRTKTGAKIRRKEIFEMVKDRNLCHIKDITSKLPNISPRTIRYDIQQMVDKGDFERVGSGGPNSFFRVKKG